MLAFNGYERLSSLRATVVGLQRLGATRRADSSPVQAKLPKAALFYCLRRTEYLPGWIPRLCVFAFVE